MKQQLRRFDGGIENLNPMIAGVSNPQSILGIHDHSLRPQETTGRCIVSAKLANVISLRIEFLNSIIVSVLTDIIIACRVLGDVGHESEFTGAATIGSSNRSFLNQFAFGRIEQDAKIVRVADHQQSVVTDRQCDRLALFNQRRSPASLKSASTIKLLNSSGFINNIDPVLGIDRNGPWLDKTTFIKSFSTPNEGASRSIRGLQAAGQQHESQPYQITSEEPPWPAGESMLLVAFEIQNGFRGGR